MWILLAIDKRDKKEEIDDGWNFFHWQRQENYRKEPNPVQRAIYGYCLSQNSPNCWGDNVEWIQVHSSVCNCDVSVPVHTDVNYSVWNEKQGKYEQVVNSEYVDNPNLLFDWEGAALVLYSEHRQFYQKPGWKQAAYGILNVMWTRTVNDAIWGWPDYRTLNEAAFSSFAIAQLPEYRFGGIYEERFHDFIGLTLDWFYVFKTDMTKGWNYDYFNRQTKWSNLLRHNSWQEILLYPITKVNTMIMQYPSSQWRGLLITLILLGGFVVGACSSCATQSPGQSAINQATETLKLPTATLTMKPTETQYPPRTIIASPRPQTLPSTLQTFDVGFRVTFVTYKLDDQNEVIKSDLLVLYPPYEFPQLLFSTENGKQDYILTRPFWSHDGQRVAFAELAGDEQNIVFSIFDIETKEVIQITEKISLDQPFSSNYTVKWSSDDKWLYLDYYSDYSNGQIVNTMTKECVRMEYRTQDELVSWSPVVADQYVSISRKNFPDPGGDILCLNEVGDKKPLKCFEDLNYILLSGNTFSWSPKGDMALIEVSDSSENYLFVSLNFIDMEWELLLVDKYFELFNFWSPNDRWIALYAYKKGINLLDIDQGHPKLIPVTVLENPQPIGWIPNDQRMIYENEYAIYLANPEELENSILIEDFSSLLRDKYQVYNTYSIDLMGTQSIPSLP